MKYANLGGCRTIDSYVRQKLDILNRTDRSFDALFQLMFSEKEGVLYERSQGYKILKTTYAQACSNALTRAAGLKALLPHAPYDSVVGIHMENSAAWIETFWAVLAAGFRPLLLNLRLDDDSLQYALTGCNAVAVIADSRTFPQQTIFQESLLQQQAPAAAGPFGTEIFVMSTGTSNNVKVCGYGAEAFCCLVSDSAYIVANCSQIKRHYNGQLKLLTFLPFYHVFGLIAVYIWFAFFSRTFVHLQDMEPQTILNTIRRHEVTHIFAVPLFWEKIFDQADRTIRQRGEATVAKYEKGLRIGKALEKFPGLEKCFRRIAFREVRSQIFGDSVQFLITGGSPIRPEALAFFNDIGYHLANGYGMTEIGITSVELSLCSRQRNTGSVGKPLPSVEYRIDGSGVLQVRGRSLARTVFQDGVWTVRGEDWFTTGDLAECTDGTYRILGRRDDLILLPNGEMLNPNLIEPRFLLPGIDGACLVDAGTAQPVLLLSVPRNCSKNRLEDLQSAVHNRLKEQKLDTHIKGVAFIAGSLLGTTEFKLNRAALARRYRSGELSVLEPDALSAGTASSQLEKQIAALMAAVLNKSPEAIGMDSDFFMDLEGTSLDYFALLSGLKDTFGLPFEESQEMTFHTLRHICRYIEGAASHVH